MDDWTNQPTSLSDRLVSWPGSGKRSRGQGGQSSAVSPQGNEEAAPADTILTMVMGSLSASVDASQLAAVLAIAEIILSELKANFDSAGMSCGDIPTEVAHGAVAPGAYSVSLEIPEACLLAVSQAKEDLQLADSPYFAAPSGGPVQLLMGAPCIRLGLKGSLDPMESGVYVLLISPLTWAAPNIGIYIPVASVYIGSSRGQEVSADGRLLCQTGAALPTPRTALRGGMLNPMELEHGTQLPDAEAVFLTLGEIQIEVKPPHKAEISQNEARHLTPPLQVFVAVERATATSRLSLAEHTACSTLLAALRTPLLPQERPIASSRPPKGLHLHLSLASLQAHLHCTETAASLQGGATAKSKFCGSSLVVSYEQRASKVCPIVSGPNIAV